MDHLSYYGLQDEPFSIVPLTSFYFHSEQHDQAMLRLNRAVRNMMGLAVLDGDVGTGKTLLARRLLESLPEDEYEVSMLVVLHSDVTSEWLIRRVAAQFGIDEGDEASKTQVVTRLYEKLNSIAEEGKRAVILIDEAHMLRNKETLEEVRGLLNLELPESKLITFVMFGMPEIDASLSQDPALKQRVAVRYSLKNFSKDVLADYIGFRLSQAGAEGNLFSDASMNAIFELSRGNPRLVNVVCDNSLFEGFIRKTDIPIGPEIIYSVGQDLNLPDFSDADEAIDRS